MTGMAKAVILAACPDGHPQILDGMIVNRIGGYVQHPDSWWVTFTCDHRCRCRGADQENFT